MANHPCRQSVEKAERFNGRSVTKPISGKGGSILNDAAFIDCSIILKDMFTQELYIDYCIYIFYPGCQT